MYVLGEASSTVLGSVFFPGRAINQLEINPLEELLHMRRTS